MWLIDELSLSGYIGHLIAPLALGACGGESPESVSLLVEAPGADSVLFVDEDRVLEITDRSQRFARRS